MYYSCSFGVSLIGGIALKFEFAQSKFTQAIEPRSGTFLRMYMVTCYQFVFYASFSHKVVYIRPNVKLHFKLQRLDEHIHAL